MPIFEKMMKDPPQSSLTNGFKDTILVIDDDKSIQRGLQRFLKYKYNVAASDNGTGGIEFLSKNEVHCIILDIKMSGMSGFDVYPKLKEIVPDIPVIFYTAFQNEHDIKLVLNKYNPQGYFGKGDNIIVIESTIDKLIKAFKRSLNEKITKDKLEKKLDQEHTHSCLLTNKLNSQYRFAALKGTSQKMIELKKICEKAIHSDITILIQGETGTGKELIANIIHSNGQRSKKDFFIQNCAAIPEHLFESELFGHKKGSFTGAIADKKGIFDLADNGTVFLDEIGDLSLSMQAKLLRLLQEGEIRPVGSNVNKYVNVRVISATNKSLANEVKKERFRKDLYYRLNVFTISAPPLREMKEDIPLLARFFLNKYRDKDVNSVSSINDDALLALMDYSFPGNIRQLENEIERAVVMAGNVADTIEIYHFSEHIIDLKKNNPEFDINNKSLKEKVISFEKKLIKEALNQNNGNKTHAAKTLGISRVGLNNKIKRYNINS